MKTFDLVELSSMQIVAYIEKLLNIENNFKQNLYKYLTSKFLLHNYSKLCLVILWVAMVGIYFYSPWVSYSGKMVIVESVGTYGIVGLSISTKTFTLIIRGYNIVKLLLDLETYRHTISLVIFIPILFLITIITIILNFNWGAVASSFITMIFIIDFYRNADILLYLFISRISPLVVEIQDINLGLGSLATIIMSAAISILSILPISWKEKYQCGIS